MFRVWSLALFSAGLDEMPLPPKNPAHPPDQQSIQPQIFMTILNLGSLSGEAGVCCPCLQEFDLKMSGYRYFGFRARSLLSGLLLSKELKLLHHKRSV